VPAEFCGTCRRCLRWNESQDVVYIQGVGMSLACASCQAKEAGLPSPQPRIYPVGTPVPRHRHGDGDMPICGMCRKALFQNESCEAIRLRHEFLTDEDGLAPGAYMACRDCVARFRGRLAAYLRAANIIKPDVPDEAVAWSLLL